MNRLRQTVCNVIHFPFLICRNISFFLLALYLCFSHKAIEAHDVVRSVENLSFFDRSLVNKIKDTHEQYQKADRENYTLNITSYPSKVYKNSCSRYKTIDFDSSQTTPYPDYQVVPGKKPRSFEVRQYKGKIIICEKTDISYKEQLLLFCGEEVKKCEDYGRTKNCSKRDIYRKCKKALPPSCSFVDQTGGSLSSQDMCIDLDRFSDLSQSLLRFNFSLEMRYCPDGCSYYTQTLQRVYKNKDKSDYCADNYLVVHCGPEKAGGEYNLNIREVSE